MPRSCRVLLVVLLLAPASLAACGGGGDGDGAPAATPQFAGTYGFLLLEWAQEDDYVRSTVGILTPDGTGGVVLDRMRGVEAGTPKTAAIAPLTYVEYGPERVVFTDRTGRRFTADVSGDGTFLAATTRENGTQPALLLLVRRSAEVALGDLAGDWMELAWARDTISTTDGDEVGDYALALDQALPPSGAMTIDGGHEIRLAEHTVIPALSASTTTVGIGAGAMVEWARAFDGLATHSGSVSEDRSLMLLGGEFASLATGGTLCVRRGQDVAASQLVGAYRMAGIGSSILGHHVRWGTATFGVAGTGSSSFEHNVEGLPLGPGSADFDHALGGESRVTVQWGDDPVPLRGIAGEDGAYVVLAGGFEDGALAELHVLFR